MDTPHRGKQEAEALGLSARICGKCRQELAIERFFGASPKVPLWKNCDACRKKHAEEDRAGKIRRLKEKRELENQDLPFDREASVDSILPRAAFPSASTSPANQETPTRHTTGGKSVKRLSDVFPCSSSVWDSDSEDNLLSDPPLPPDQESVQTGPEEEERLSPSSTGTNAHYRVCCLCRCARALNRVETLSDGVYLCEYCKASNSEMQWCVQCSMEKPKIQFMDLKAQFHGTCNQCRAAEEEESALCTPTKPQEITGSEVSLPSEIKRTRLILRGPQADK